MFSVRDAFAQPCFLLSLCRHEKCKGQGRLRTFYSTKISPRGLTSLYFSLGMYTSMSVLAHPTLLPAACFRTKVSDNPKILAVSRKLDPVAPGKTSMHWISPRATLYEV
ncbi:hypothetical protein BJX96DRAFT_153548 [Aspergillus floccosus]